MVHVQFDDMYIYYHMKEPIEFFNLEVFSTMPTRSWV